MSEQSYPRNVVHLAAYDQNGQQTANEFIPLSKFYDQAHPLLDDPGFRKAHGIVRLRGLIHGESELVVEEFEVTFDESGLCECDAARFADGSIAGDWERMRKKSASGE